MITLPNDSFDMCCGAGPHVTSTCTKVYTITESEWEAEKWQSTTGEAALPNRKDA